MFGAEIEEMVSKERRDRFGKEQAEHDESEKVDPLGMSAAQSFVDRHADRLWIRERREHPEKRGGQSCDIAAAFLPHQAPQSTKLRFHRSVPCIGCVVKIRVAAPA